MVRQNYEITGIFGVANSDIDYGYDEIGPLLAYIRLVIPRRIIISEIENTQRGA